MAYKSVVQYCVEHGPFVGLRWNGHRIHCKAGATTKKIYEEAAKSTVASPKKSGTSSSAKIPGKIGESLGSLSVEMNGLNLRLEELGIEIENREKEVFQLTQLRSKIKEAIHGILGEGNA